MKKIILMLALVAAQVGHAQVREIKKISREQAREQVRKLDVIDKMEKLRSEHKNLESSPELKKVIETSVSTKLKEFVNVDATQTAAFLKLLNANPTEVMAQFVELRYKMKASDSTPAEKVIAKKTIEIMLKSSGEVKSLVKDAAGVEAQKQNAKNVMEVAEKAAAQDAKNPGFNKALEKALEEGKSLEVAVKEAFKAIGKEHTLKDLLECV